MKGGKAVITLALFFALSGGATAGNVVWTPGQARRAILARPLTLVDRTQPDRPTFTFRITEIGRSELQPLHRASRFTFTGKAIELFTGDQIPVSLTLRPTGPARFRVVFFRGPPPDTSQPSFPIRAAFFYPWFPRNWTQLGLYPFTRFHPTLGFYETTAPSVVRSQLTALSYGNFDAALYSWWGQGSEEDSRFSLFLDASRETSFRWAVYYEPEAYGKPTVAQLQSDLRYIRDQYAEKPAYLRVDNRPFVFVYGDESCDRAAAWEQANVIDAYLVLKVFPGYQSCPEQPDGWHQYGPAAR